MINAASSGLIISISNIIRSVIHIDLHFDKNFAIAFSELKYLTEASEEELVLDDGDSGQMNN